MLRLLEEWQRFILRAIICEDILHYIGFDLSTQWSNVLALMPQKTTNWPQNWPIKLIKQVCAKMNIGEFIFIFSFLPFTDVHVTVSALYEWMHTPELSDGTMSFSWNTDAGSCRCCWQCCVVLHQFHHYVVPKNIIPSL